MKGGIEQYCRILWREPLAPYTTFKVGGEAEALALPASLQELSGLANYLTKNFIPWFVLGRGSNVLIGDKGVEGVVVLLGDNLSSLELIEEDDAVALVKVQSGCSLARLLGWSIERGLSGLEFSVGIPGSLGGGIVMNCGAWGEAISEVISTVTIMRLDGSFHKLSKGDLPFNYRNWGGDEGSVVIEALLCLTKSRKSAVREKCRKLQKQRRKKQPLGTASSGCFFRNPPGERTAGQLIDEAGLKGLSVGSAQVSEIHANFIVNHGGANSADIIDLAKIVRREVQRKSSINLDPEVKFLGC